MADAADAAERLRSSGMDITFVAGCEYSLFGKGVFPGSTFNERLQWLFNLGKEPEKAPLRAAARRSPCFRAWMPMAGLYMRAE